MNNSVILVCTFLLAGCSTQWFDTYSVILNNVCKQPVQVTVPVWAQTSKGINSIDLQVASGDSVEIMSVICAQTQTFPTS
jgi:uncharacterized lipoprotein YajG